MTTFEIGNFPFLDGDVTCPLSYGIYLSICPSVRPSVRLSVCLSVFFFWLAHKINVCHVLKSLGKASEITKSIMYKTG